METRHKRVHGYRKKRSFTGTLFDNLYKSEPSNTRQRATDQDINRSFRLLGRRCPPDENDALTGPLFDAAGCPAGGKMRLCGIQRT
jgi:hypothetical protein